MSDKTTSPDLVALVRQWQAAMRAKDVTADPHDYSHGLGDAEAALLAWTPPQDAPAAPDAFASAVHILACRLLAYPHEAVEFAGHLIRLSEAQGARSSGVLRDDAPDAMPPVPETNGEIQTCERCQMKLHENLGTFTPGIRGSMAWRCAACLPIEGPSGRLMREHIVMLRRRVRGAR